MIELLKEPDAVGFGDIPPEVDALLQRGVVAYRRDRAEADGIFRAALAAAPDQLPVYLCLYKTHTYQGHLAEARRIAELGLAEAARQAGWSPDWREWQPVTPLPDGAGRFALYTLKALAFIHLRSDEPAQAKALLAKLASLDPGGSIGWPVITALADALE